MNRLTILLRCVSGCRAVGPLDVDMFARNDRRLGIRVNESECTACLSYLPFLLTFSF